MYIVSFFVSFGHIAGIKFSVEAEMHSPGYTVLYRRCFRTVLE